jgi:hypothetical protein
MGLEVINIMPSYLDSKNIAFPIAYSYGLEPVVNAKAHNASLTGAKLLAKISEE